MPRAEIDDTYAEAFRSIFAEVLITAKDRRWLDEAVRAATGNASSTILCDCEAGLDRYVGPGGDGTIVASVDTPGVVKISAGNYGGRLGKSFVHLLPGRDPA